MLLALSFQVCCRSRPAWFHLSSGQSTGMVLAKFKLPSKDLWRMKFSPPDGSEIEAPDPACSHPQHFWAMPEAKQAYFCSKDMSRKHSEKDHSSLNENDLTWLVSQKCIKSIWLFSFQSMSIYHQSCNSAAILPSSGYRRSSGLVRCDDARQNDQNDRCQGARQPQHHSRGAHDNLGKGLTGSKAALWKQSSSSLS